MTPAEQSELLSALLQNGEQESATPSVLPPVSWEPKLNPIQLEVYRDESIFCLAYGERGCLSTRAQVYTDTGLSPYEDLPDSGSVISWAGTPNVQRFLGKEISHKPAYQTQLSHGGTIESSYDHPIWCCAEPPSDPDHAAFGFWTVGKIQKKRSEGWKFWTPLVEHPNWVSDKYALWGGIKVDEDVGYMLGALVGDGGLNNIRKPRRSVYFSNVDQECVARVARGARKFNSNISFSKTTCSMWFAPKKPLSDFLVYLELDKLSYEKRIPKLIIQSPKSVVSSFLRGLFDTDGTISPAGRVSITSTSRDLLQDTLALLTAFGILATVRRFNSASGRSTWRLNISGPSSIKFGQEIGFEISRKAVRIKKFGGKHQHYYNFPPSIKAALYEAVTTSENRTRLPPRFRNWYASGSIPTRATVEQVLPFATTPHLEKYLSGFAWVEVLGSAPCSGVLYDILVPGTHSYLAHGMVHHNSGKTVGALHKLVKHCYNNYNALAVIIVGVRRQAVEGGSWYKLAYDVLPEWKNGMGLEYTDPKTNTAKDEYLFIANRYGGWSRVLLLSMPVESFVRDRSKGLEPSLILVDEAQTLESDAYFSALVQQLGRRPNISDPQQYIACCNPEGPSNWVYQRFFKKGKNEDGTPAPGYSVHHVPISDNEHNLPPGYYDRVKEALKDDEIEYRRLVLGEWIDRPSGTAIFGHCFNDGLHVRGDEVAGTRILPNPKYPITIGYDLGTANSAVVFTQNIPTSEKDVWVVFDEMIFTDAYIPYTDLVPAIMRRIKFWNDRMGAKFTVEHISDSSAFNQFRATHGTYDAWEVERISRECAPDFEGVQPIVLIECPKPPNSIQARVKVLLRALQSERFIISVSCTKLRDMFLHLESEKLSDKKYSPDLPFKPRRSKHIHGFDALSYPMFYYELDSSVHFLRVPRPATELLPVGTR